MQFSLNGVLAISIPLIVLSIGLGNVQGLGYLLPTNLRIFFEIQKPRPDGEKIGRWMRTYVRVVGVQGVMQVAIIVVMARFSTGL